MSTDSRSLLFSPDLRKPGGGLYEREFWGISRHEAIAGAAEQFLTETARGNVARVTNVLGPGIGLADLAGWADLIKHRAPDPSSDDTDTVAFLSDPRNSNNDSWHYVNVPLDADAYDRQRYPEFTSDEDVVQMIGHATRVLARDSDRFSELNALRLVTHLVGDVHQPIHVGCCYISGSGQSAKLVRDPAVAAQNHLRHDRGGNALYLPIGSNGVSLHSYWDSRLGGSSVGPDEEDHEHEADVEAVSPIVKAQFVLKLVEMTRAEPPVEADAAFDTSTPDRWAETWATEALIAARDAYHSIRISGPRGSSKTQFNVSFEGRDHYDERCAPIVRRQMTAATRHLADLLNALWE